jgi:hypothetical protein
MARKIFFSFHYEDVKSFRVNVVRNSNIIKRGNAGNVFSDGSLWEEAKSKTKKNLHSLIENVGLHDTSVTAVLIGSNTFERPFVRYELIKSFELGKGLLGIHINRIRSKDGYICAKGKNPFDYIGLTIEETGQINFFEFINRRWVPFSALPSLNNRKSNTIYFEERTPLQKIFGEGKEKYKFYKFSELFETFCWVNDDGSSNFSDWIEEAHGGFIL